jgi:hypothetical protein
MNITEEFMFQRFTSTDRIEHKLALGLAGVSPAGFAGALAASATGADAVGRTWTICSTKRNSRNVDGAKHVVWCPMQMEKGFSREVRAWS